MNLKSIYLCLQCDISSTYGVTPQLDVSEIPQYEAFWKNLLVLVEALGDVLVTEVEHVSGTSCTYRIWATTRDSCFATFLEIPAGLVDLTYIFLYSAEPKYLRALRQICLFTYKSKSNSITTEQEVSAIEGWVQRNAVCQSLSYSHYVRLEHSELRTSQVLKLARLFWRHVTCNWDYRSIRPSHGPGAVSDASGQLGKWRAIDGHCTRLMSKVYPISDYFTPSPGMFVESQASYVDGHAKLAIVPKDKRGPRIICTQPSSAMWIQQGQRRNLERTVERSRLIAVPNGTGSSIKFDNQEQNGGLALSSSLTRELATIDLKDASDLVSWGLVRYLSHKEVSLALATTRTMYVQLPEKRLVKLHMYAPMGSAMCFPIESLVFWVIATAAMHVHRGVRYETLCRNPRAFKALLGMSEVFVFGDDVIAPSNECDSIVQAFMDVGFKPNFQKTFRHGFYRESCGVDAYKGERLDIARLQSSTITSMSEAYANIDLARRARSLGLYETSTYLECQVESFLGFGLCASCLQGGFWDRGFPCSSWGSQQALDWNIAHKRKFRFNSDLQRFEGKTIIARPRTVSATQDDRYRLFRGLTTGVSEHALDWLSPDSFQYYQGWAAAF